MKDSLDGCMKPVEKGAPGCEKGQGKVETFDVLGLCLPMS